MSARQRESVERSPASDSKMTYTEFIRRFPTSDACLDFLKERHYANGTPCPKCGKPSRFHRISGRSAYSCQFCGHHVFPTAGTIFHKSTTSLQLWFWAIYLISSSKCGISAKQLGREIGTTYKTAHRMLKQIRTLLADDEPLSGEVEMDETFFGGKVRASETRGMTQAEAIRFGIRKKQLVFAAVERGGRVRAAMIPDRGKATLTAKAREFVLPESMIYTDEWALYETVGREFKSHKRINHKQRVYVDGDITTNTAESFFALFKNSVRGAHHSISTKYLPNYLNEYTFRWNHRKDERAIFWSILDRVRQDRLADA
ncbi:MAG: IS1595 family transposase [Gaiella sp.]